MFIFQLGWKKTLTMYPFVLHSVALSLFSSVIGPFGGFFASGFKRAFKIKVRILHSLVKFVCKVCIWNEFLWL